MEKFECQVCVGDLKTVIECPSCEYKACAPCVKRYMMGSHYDAHCMNCRNIWGRKFLTFHFSKSFLTGEFKNHRANVLFEREKSLFLETMDAIQEDERREVLRAQILQLERAKRDLERQIQEARNQLFARPLSGASVRERSHYVRPCAHPECKGFIDEGSGLCGLCHLYTCCKCNAGLKTPPTDTPTHTCTEEDLANWQEIRTHSRPCPSCHARIHRSSGCNQMWCPLCHTAFNYSTGEIEKGVVHNPHYVDFVRNHGFASLLRQERPDHANCDLDRFHRRRLPYVYVLSGVLSKKDRDSSYNTWLQFHRFLAHVRAVELPKYQTTTTQDFHRLTLDLRKDFMRNKISEEKYKKRIQEREKKLLKEREYYSLFQTFYTIGAELIFSIIQHRVAIDQAATQRDTLRQFFNEGMRDVSTQFQSKPIEINDEYHFVEYSPAL